MDVDVQNRSLDMMFGVHQRKAPDFAHASPTC